MVQSSSYKQIASGNYLFFYCLWSRLSVILETSCDLTVNSVGFIAPVAP